ncbi:lanthionine synthetase LanC family protein [Mucilaginibacter sp.]|uniref:lanthionine synthetase LanC family protein n=1 Tax=Mucilaginibacter sp. TaxID=1882438 RepID=UPI0025F45C1A|nr:lanthionine synthetase LanC family protein [Mucilaginibacter sp.]
MNIAPKVEQIIKDTERAGNVFTGPGVLQGLAGKMLYHYYLYRYFGKNATNLDAVKTNLDAVNRMLCSGYASDYYVMELCEYGKLLCYLHESDELAIQSGEYLELTDKLIIEQFKDTLATRNYDPHYGAIACGNYFLDRFASNPIVSVFLMELLQKLKDEFKEGIDRVTLPEINSYTIKKFLGISHGLAGVLMFLINLLETNQWSSGAEERPLIKMFSDFLWSKEQDYQMMGCCFPDMLDASTYRTPLYITYGDLGIIYTLYRSAAALSDDTRKAAALELLKKCASRRKLNEETKIKHAGMETGSAGLMAFFRFLFEISEEPALMQAAEYWLETTIALGEKIPENTTSGYEFVYNQTIPSNNFSFTGGIIGIGIALIYASVPGADSSFLKFYNFR